MNTINDINTNTQEGRLLMAALAVISTLPGFTDKTPDEVLAHVKGTAAVMYSKDPARPPEGRYGGEGWLVRDIPVGTKFYVHNGNWYGEIVEVDGKRYVKEQDGDILGGINPFNEDYKLDITIGKERNR